ncbi:MAG: ATP synthase F0F1 subunit epsilon [Microbacteriaceae bacterium BACL25 MAG-120322-bin65]|jgi:F-type H+-transporting ATPase subunit epsilon|nr:MAG: ATP synthase F0F1 subunit epsilon [Microbacteriaceae bacterium BACL25 MAG-120322-bin65]HAA80007.1 F0F1 ATP synthase subunit epsilon [Microbacteriaceae bacterium]|tara:strand:+ start:417 stop:683 length:267 start_codon:yes stop_codon:yes gene_type:complete
MANLQVTVVSAVAEVWSGEATMVVARTTEGEIGILAGHEPTLGVLAAGEVRITTVDGQKVTASAEDGFLSVDNDQVTIVAGLAEITSA